MLFIALFQKPIFNMKHVTSKTWYWISKICKHLARFLLFGTRKILLLLTGIFRLLITCLALVLRNFLTFNSSSYFFLLLWTLSRHLPPPPQHLTCHSQSNVILMYKLFALHLETSNQRAAVKVHSGDALEWHSEAGACLSSHFWTFSSSCFGHCASRSCHLTFKSPSESREFLQQISLVSLGTPALVSVDSIGVLKQDLTRRCWCLRRWRGRCLVQHPKRVLIVPEAEILV